MTRDAFIVHMATLDPAFPDLLALGFFFIEPCDCGEPGCIGWVLLPRWVKVLRGELPAEETTH
jgi:hypothetical protein